MNKDNNFIPLCMIPFIANMMNHSNNEEPQPGPGPEPVDPFKFTLSVLPWDRGGKGGKYWKICFAPSSEFESTYSAWSESIAINKSVFEDMRAQYNDWVDSGKLAEEEQAIVDAGDYYDDLAGSNIEEINLFVDGLPADAVIYFIPLDNIEYKYVNENEFPNTAIKIGLASDESGNSKGLLLDYTNTDPGR